MESSVPATAACAAVGVALGLIAHLGFFIHGEWHVRAPEIFVSHVGLLALFTCGTILYNGALAVVFKLGLVTSLAYLAAMVSSILVYRIWFHALSKAGFEGPWFLRTSKIWHVWVCRNSTNHLYLDKLHRQYGDFIRTGRSFACLSLAVRHELTKYP
jgi:hypothetical protein